MKLSLAPVVVEVSDDLKVGDQTTVTVGITVSSVSVNDSLGPDGEIVQTKTGFGTVDEPPVVA